MTVKAHSTRDNIVDVARDLFYRQGFDATSYGDIALQAKVGKGNVHYYFKSKDELLTAVVARRMSQISQLLEEWSLSCGTPYDCLERFVAMIENNGGDLIRYGCPMGTLNGELGKDHQALQAVSREMFDLFLRWLEARFLAIMPRAQAREHAEHLMVMAQGASVMAHTYGEHEILRRQAGMMRTWLARVCDADSIGRCNI